jgi:hypothetical protein
MQTKTRRILNSLLLFVTLLTTTIALAQVLPLGYIGTVTNNTPNTWQTYSYSFTPNISGTNYVGFAFRQDPAFWTFDNVSLTESGSTVNLLTNGAFTTGGAINITTSNGPGTIQAPTNWGVWYQNGTYPAAAGTWNNIGGSHGGVWYDGAVGTFDGIYQGIGLLAGTTYTITFEVSGNHVSNGSSVQLGIYAGPCADTTIAVASCTIPSSAGFTTLATPAEGATAGNPTPTIVSQVAGTPIVSESSSRGTTTTTVTNTRGTTTYVPTTTYTPTRQDPTLSVNRNITTVATTPITTVTTHTTPITTTTITTPTTIQTWSDGSTTTVNGTPVTTTAVINEILTGTSTANEVVTTQANRVFTTRIDQLDKLDKISTLQNQNSLADPLVRNKVSGNKITTRGPVNKESQVYVTGYALRSGTTDTYKYTTNVFGIGYEQKYNDSLLLGAQFNYGGTELTGDSSFAGGQLKKYSLDLFAMKVEDDWILKTNFGMAYNEFETAHFMRGLNLLNTASTKGHDTWFVNRLYTPDMYGFRPFAGLKLEYDYRKSVFETGPTLTAVRHSGRSDFEVTGHGGIRFEQDIVEDLTGVIEGLIETNKTKTAFAGFSYAFDQNSSIMLKYAIQEKESVVNNIIGAQIRIMF